MYQVNVDLPTEDPRDGRFVAGPDGQLYGYDTPEADFASREEAAAAATAVTAAYPEARVVVVGPFAPRPTYGRDYVLRTEVRAREARQQAGA